MKLEEVARVADLLALLRRTPQRATVSAHG
jgi:hypothetical protein